MEVNYSSPTGRASGRQQAAYDSSPVEAGANEDEMENIFASLIDLGNKAKDIQDYDLANKCMAVALNKYFGLSLWEREATTDSPPPAWLVWETQDEAGTNFPETYYDLLVIEVPPSGSNFRGLSIPAPLLKNYVMITALKCANVAEREDHDRETRGRSEGEVEALKARLLEIVSQEEVDRAVGLILAKEEEVIF